MKKHCPYCMAILRSCENRPKVIKAGYFKRKSDSRKIQRWRCLECKKYFSNATTHPCFRQKKRNYNLKIFKSLCSNMSLRRVALELNLSRTTVARKLQFLGAQARLQLSQYNREQTLAKVIEFDDMETFEHSKCKPLSITLAVEHKSRRILGFSVSAMPAKGKLTSLAKEKYARRKDERSQARLELFSSLKSFVSPTAIFKSDQNPHYPKDLKVYFPLATHEQYKGQRGSIVGQGELKKIRFDPLFSLNHTCAMLRANVNRLIRKTWCTTKLPQRLSDHIAMYALYHNLYLLKENLPAG